MKTTCELCGNPDAEVSELFKGLEMVACPCVGNAAFMFSKGAFMEAAKTGEQKPLTIQQKIDRILDAEIERLFKKSTEEGSRRDVCESCGQGGVGLSQEDARTLEILVNIDKKLREKKPEQEKKAPARRITDNQLISGLREMGKTE